MRLIDYLLSLRALNAHTRVHLIVLGLDTEDVYGESTDCVYVFFLGAAIFISTETKWLLCLNFHNDLNLAEEETKLVKY